jgi:hypothetical protein
MTKFEAIAKLERAVEQAERLRVDASAEPPFSRWRRDTLVAIKHIFGADSTHVGEFERIGFSVVRVGGYSYSFGQVLNPTPDSAHRDAFQSGLRHAVSLLQSMIAEIREYWPDAQEPPQNCRGN